MTGVIRRLMTLKGYGFIKPDDSEVEMFFHFSALRDAKFDTLQEGFRVEFEAGSGERGPRAENIRVIRK